MQCYLLKNKRAGFEPDASVRDLYVRGLDPLNGMANCPGYHGYERVWEHINHKDLGFFLFYFFFFPPKKTQNRSVVLYEADLRRSISVRVDHGKWAWEVRVYERGKRAACSLCQRTAFVLECVFVGNGKVSEGLEFMLINCAVWIVFIFFIHFLHWSTWKVCAVTWVGINVWKGAPELQVL